MLDSRGRGPVATSAMVARPKELLRELCEGNETLKALKAIKNQVIGNKFKKNAFVNEGAVEQVLEVLKGTRSNSFSADQAKAVQQQAAIVIGSLSGSEAGLRILMAQGGLPLLVTMLHSGDEAVVEAGLWAVKMVVQQSTHVPSYLTGLAAGNDNSSHVGEPSASPAAPAAVASAANALSSSATARASPPICLDASAMSAVVHCLATGSTAGADPASSGGASGGACSSSPSAGDVQMDSGAGKPGRGAVIAALAAAVVACCCRRDEERDLAIAAGAPERLLRLLLESGRPDTQLAALEGLSLMLPHQPAACAMALARPAVYGRLLTLLRDPSAAVRLLAASCAATLSRVPGCQQPEALQRAALPVLLRLLVQPATRPHVPAVLARLIEGNEALQKAAADADTVRLLAGLLAGEAVFTAPATQPPAAPLAAAAASASAPASSSGGSSCRLREGCLRALGSLCLDRDDSRKQLLEAKVLRHIVRSLEDPHGGVRAAAALCVRALSRCVRTLRGGLLEGGGGELATMLVGLLGDEHTDVQISAAAALCNLVLDFSSVKSAVLAAGGLPRLVGLTASPHTALRHHATWALANLLYRADNGVRLQLMQALPWSRLQHLVSDTDPRVVEQALVLLRNLCMGDRHHIAAALEWASPGGGDGAGDGGGASGGGDEPAGRGGDGAAAGASASRILHPIHGYQHQQQGRGGGGQPCQWQEGLLDVLQTRILAAAAASAAGREQQQEEAGADGEEVQQERACGGAASSPDARDEDEPMAISPTATANAATPISPRAAVTSEPWGPSATAAIHTTCAAAGSHALYALANLLTGGAVVKDRVAARRPLLAAVAAHLQPAAAAELALPAVWCIVNLSWVQGGGGVGGGSDREGQHVPEAEAVAARCRAVAAVRAEELLEALVRGHPSRDVQERARTALEQLRGTSGRGQGAAAGVGGELPALMF